MSGLAYEGLMGEVGGLIVEGVVGRYRLQYKRPHEKEKCGR